MIIKEMFYIPIKLKPELARASMTVHSNYANILKNMYRNVRKNNGIG
jgi:hypothetical protein